VDFIYHGEANIFQEDLDGFLALAEELQLQGLNETESTQQEQGKSEYEPSKLKKGSNHHSIERNDSKSNIWQEFEPEVDMVNTSVVHADAYAVKSQTNNEELDATLNTMMEKNTDGKWECNSCEKSPQKKSHMREHIETNHIDGVSDPCSLCGKSFRSRHSLSTHIFRFHKIK
jgi:hypothetical protein